MLKELAKLWTGLLIRDGHLPGVAAKERARRPAHSATPDRRGCGAGARGRDWRPRVFW